MIISNRKQKENYKSPNGVKSTPIKLMKRMILKNTLMTFLVKRNKTLGKKEIQI
jgi:hypothetical protein